MRGGALAERERAVNSFKDRGHLGLVLKSVLVGLLTGAVVALYRQLLTLAEGFCLSVYGYLGEHPALIPLGLAALTALGWGAGRLVQWRPLIAGSGIPQIKGLVAGLFKDTWLTTLAAKFAGGLAAIGAGLSLGREGPSIQLGACVADGLSRRLVSTEDERRALIAGGASAGLAAAFNAPLSGVLFAFEEIFRSLSPVRLISTALAAIAADYVASVFFGIRPVFSFHIEAALPLGAYWLPLALGALMGLAGAAYNASMLWLLRGYDRLWPRHRAWKPVPMFWLALPVGLLCPLALGSGHALLELIKPETGLGLLLLLLAAKFAFSLVSFASGAPGGIFFPLLVLGAIMGAVFGLAATRWLGLDQALFVNFVCLAMAGFFAAIVRAPITGVLLLTEMTGSLEHLLPFALVSITAYITADALHSEPIYDSLLADLTRPARVGSPK
ncbi:hydrolase acting on acid anhydrides in phosphorous-containing anhydrides [Deltaproteobacteria bacterium]|nr:hydrolase acting on acid anhydrides in phosphorous-containing anhydrides [Deltaproteobacteria bacterium]